MPRPTGLGRRLLPWIVVWGAGLGLALLTSIQALDRYHGLRTGWSWDLAYYNQWFWTFTQGDGTITVRPLSSYAVEGPSVWKMSYLSPLRFALLPVYLARPDPRTLLVVHNILFWLVVPAAYGLAKSESGSTRIALAATALVPATPLLWLLAWNDFRELQLGLPFVLWAVQGWRSRDRRLTAIGFVGMLACRQEFAVVIATFAVIDAREREDVGKSYLWAWSAMMIGLGWLFFAFFTYLSYTAGPRSPEAYYEQFGGHRAGVVETALTAGDFLAIGMGSWVVWALFAPRVAVLALPWIWSLSNGKWALRFVSTIAWHHIRYTTPFVALMLAAGLIGFARTLVWLARRPGLAPLAPCLWLASLVGLLSATSVLLDRFNYVTDPFPPADVAAYWTWRDRVAPADGVLAVYEVTAPLSSRRFLYSYVLDSNKPKGYPQLDDRFRWVFGRVGDFAPKTFLEQGFELVYHGQRLLIFRRAAGPS